MSEAAKSYDPRRFQTTVPYYGRYRLAYPDRLIRRVVERVGLLPGDAVMDLGCGPGLLAIPFATAGMAVTGIDPEPAMLAAARDAAQKAGAALELKQGSSFDMPAGIGPFRLVTMGRSFHWMDREATLKILDGMVTAGGAIALMHDHHTKTVENRWRRVFHEIADEYGRGDSFHVQARGRDDRRAHESVLMNSVFAHVERVSVFVKTARTLDGIVGLAFSMSTTAPQKLGARKDEFERDLRARLLALSPDGHFGEIAEMTALIATRA